MKTITQLTNVDKAKIIFDLFRDEIPELLDYTQKIAFKIEEDKEQLIASWNNPFLTYDQWLNLAYQVSGNIKRYGKNLTKSANMFAEQLFDGYLAIFSNHCVEQYGRHKAKSKRFVQAVDLFYSPLTEPKTDGEFLILELNGGAQFAAICTDGDGNNLVFANRKDAVAEAAECQIGFIVEL